MIFFIIESLAGTVALSGKMVYFRAMPDAPPPEPGFTFLPARYPDSPGVYLMKDASGRILYVGKAKSLRKRLSSYFRAGAAHTVKTRALLVRVARIDLLHTATEKEALLLEASLIKKHRPRYNVVLRDDKQYVLFRLDKASDWPRLVMTRRVLRDGSAYFGPFTSASSAHQTFRLLGRVFPLRKCSDRAFQNRVRPCLYHDMGQCLAPCVRAVDPAAYRDLVRRVELMLRGRAGELLQALERDMLAAADRLEFERAAELRDQVRAVRRTVEQQAAVLAHPEDLDVVALAGTPEGVGAGLCFVREGRLIDEKPLFFPGLTLEDGPEVVEGLLTQYYTSERFIPPRVLIPFEPGDLAAPEALEAALAEARGGPVRIQAPRTAEEKRLHAIAREAAARARGRGEGDIGALLARRLRLPGPPSRIECVDISHLGGSGVRAGVVAYEDGRRVPELSRLYDLDELAPGGDDYAALAAWAARRAASDRPLPDLVLIDGGRGQLEAVRRGFAGELGGGGAVLGPAACGAPEPEGEPGLESEPEPAAETGAEEGGRIPALAAIAKGPTRRAGELEDRIFRPGRKNPLPLKPGSPELLFLQRLRDEAHRFVLGRQRRARKRQVLDSELMNLPGVGPKTARLLWDRFGSLEAMLAATPEDLAGLPGLGRVRGARVAEALARLRAARRAG
ncbi:MAG: excinuclease ABC subunit UvrC [Desulfovibrionaceae bacterium]